MTFRSRQGAGVAMLLAASVLLASCAGKSAPATGATGANAAATQAGASPSSGITVAGDGIQFGSGWFPVEHYKGQVFRWSTNDAEITVCPTREDRTLAALIEPGPGIGASTLALTVMGNHGDRLTTTVRGPQYVKVAVANGVPAETFLFQATHTKNLPAPHDPRVLNFRVLHAVVGSSMTNCPSGIVRGASPLALKTGWYPLETYQGETFRWVDTDAAVTVTRDEHAPFVLEANLEPGPSLGGAPLVIALRDADGKVIAESKPIVGRNFVRFSLPPTREGTTYRLSVHSQDRPVPHDKRTLNFRVFSLKLVP